MATLRELDARWLGGMYGEPERSGMGVSFDCPHCTTTVSPTRLAVYFANPLDGGAPADDTFDPGFADVGGELHHRRPRWQRTGETIETLTLSPSVDASTAGHWHGFVRDGLAS